MASSKALMLGTVLVAVILIYNSPQAAGQCGGSLIEVATECLPFVKKDGPRTPPSKGCCDALKPIDVTCACTYLTGSLLGGVSIQKVIYVAETCGVHVPHGTKCGDYEVPPAAEW